jgi:hypothetical protein
MNRVNPDSWLRPGNRHDTYLRTRETPVASTPLNTRPAGILTRRGYGWVAAGVVLTVLLSLGATIAGCSNSGSGSSSPAAISGPFQLHGTVVSVTDTSIRVKDIVPGTGSDRVKEWLAKRSQLEIHGNRKEGDPVTGRALTFRNTETTFPRLIDEYVLVTGELLDVPTAYGGSTTRPVFATAKIAQR